MWSIEGLHNESDVEQKFIYPLLVEPQPMGLGLPSAVVQTKANIRRFLIGKGADQKLYFPDYLIVTMGYPLLVLEAKHPMESVEEGYRQARLYAYELNALYPHGISPTQFVVASNGIEIWYGHVDQAEPVGKAECKSLGPYSSHIACLIDLLSWDRINERAVTLAQSSRPTELFKPRRLLGGFALQNEEVAQNTFGTTLTSEVSSIFNPTTPVDRAFIARNAYISSRRRERYVDPIDRVIRAARPPSETQTIPLNDTGRPTELIGKFRDQKELEHKVLLLIGSVGSGKSTFVDHLYEVALPRELIDSTVWCRINMNSAPISPDEIYTWLRREIIDGCRRSLSNEDFDDLDVMRRLYSVEINRFKKGVGKLYESQTHVYNIKLAEHIENIQKDQQIVANAHVRFVCGERTKLFIIVLDNCDKKTRDEQLLMFEAAQWLQKEYRCLVILPLRDETYDNHRDQPPLDTALKDLVFRIEPPLFQQVLIKRVQFALKSLAGKGNEKLHFSLPNGITVEYPRSDQAYYLTSIVKSLFEHDRFVRRMIVGLSGRNIRRALEIFLEFCNSGYIGEDQIFKIRQSEGNYVLPLHQVATVLLRMNRRFYDSDHSYIKNMFAVRKDDPLPGYFCRYMILRWLRNNFEASGVGGLKGYFPKREIKLALVPYGLSPSVLDREFNYLLAAQCIIAEHLRLDSIENDDLVRLGPAGFVHLELVGNINYLAAVSEDTFFSDRMQAERVAQRMKNADSHLRVKSAIENAEEMVFYLESVRKALMPQNGSYMQNDLLEALVELTDAREALIRVAKSQSTDPWFDADKRLRRRSVHHVTVSNIVDFGYFVEFDDGLVGLIHKKYSGGLVVSSGDRVEVIIIWVDVIQRKMGLQLLSVIQEDVGDQIDGISAGAGGK
jgi:hypothetical protein